MSNPVPILMYHRVTPDDPDSFAPHSKMFSALAVSPGSFESQMQWLSEEGYRSITLDDLLDAREHGTAIPHRSFVLTFDDGYRDFVDYAAPVLREHGFTAHIFLVAGSVGRIAAWDYDEYGWEFPLFDWDDARELESQGFHCDAHGLSHRRLGELAAEDCRREILEGTSLIENELGRRVRHFAYPHGSYNPETQVILREAGFRSACSVQEGLSPDGDDPYALHRVWVHADDSLSDFQWAVRTGVPLKRWPVATYRMGRDYLRGLLMRGS